MDVAVIDWGLSFFAHEVGQNWPDFTVLVDYLCNPVVWPVEGFQPTLPSESVIARDPHLLDAVLLQFVDHACK